MTTLLASQARLTAGMARADITPPVGMYHRMWGAAVHDRSTGVHRPLTTTTLWMTPRAGEATSERGLMIVALDHCILERSEMDRVREAVAQAATIRPRQVHVCLSHTHGAGFMSRSRAELPGGDLIGPYLDEMAKKVAECAAEAQRNARPATLVCGTARCDLARHRNYFDAASKQFVCGFNPAGAADDTLLVGRLTDDGGAILGTLVNYACHPTTLAWQNTLVSPDYVGAMREVIENETNGAPCLFLQGASGDLGPLEGFVGDVQVADRNGKQLGWASLAAIESLPPPNAKFVYTGAVVSGATLGTWRHVPLDAASQAEADVWQISYFEMPLDYRADLPTLEQSTQDLERRREEEVAARKAGDEALLSEARARTERLTRQRSRLELLPPGKTFPYEVSVARSGGVLWVFAPGELYQLLQLELRRRVQGKAVFVATVCDDWQPGYLPTRETYGRGIYQEQIAVVAAGSLETVIEQTVVALQSLV